MKKFLLVVSVLLLVACSQQIAPIATQTQQPESEILVELSTATLIDVPTSTSIPQTFTSTPWSTTTPQPPATCPAINQKIRIPLGPVFKDKKAPYHDARTVVTNFLNAGGDPKMAIEKLAENNVNASLLDLTHDGVPELILPSGYLTIWGCQDGKYVTFLDVPPSERNATAIPLVIQDLNQNGLLELFIGQVYRQDLASYRILEWTRTQFESLLPPMFRDTNFYVEKQVLYAIGQGNAEKGALDGNWEVLDLDGNGLKEIVVRAGVYDSHAASFTLEHSLVLNWNGESYIVSKMLKESTPTPIPTFTPLPFSATCAIKVPELQFQKPGFDKVDEDIINFLNAGGLPKKFESFYDTTIQDLNNDTAPEIILINHSSIPHLMLFTCENGAYIKAVDFPDDFYVSLLSVMAIKDNNKNGFPEIFVEAIGCGAGRCGGLYVVEWNGERFAHKLIDPDFSGVSMNYADIDEPNDSYLIDLDGDGVDELVWTGEVSPDWSAEYWSFYPQRLATHVFKWDGMNYVAQPVEYSAPKYRFQAVQDGDIYSKTGQYEKALQSYKSAITSNSLDWWTEELYNYVMGSHGIGACAENVTACLPTEDPNERQVLSAYALFKTMVVHLLMNDVIDAEATYAKLSADHPTDTPGHKITQMAIQFWDEYQRSQNISEACTQAVSYIKIQSNVLVLLTGSDHDLQGISYKSNPTEVCPFK